MKRRTLYSITFCLLITAISASFLMFDFYVSKSSKEIINAVTRAEAASIQQGNLLLAITKLQSSVRTSENLAGIAVYDKNQIRRVPLILLGEMPPFKKFEKAIRVGVFDRIYFQSFDDKVIAFFFRPKFVSLSFWIFSFSLLCFSFALAFLVRQLDVVRIKERTSALLTISNQISHDIKSPLGAIKIFADVMQKKGMELELVKNSVDRIEEIVDDLKHQAESENDIYNAPIRFDVDHAIAQVVSEKKIRFPGYSLSVKGNTFSSIVGFEGQFKRVISNLLNNAIEASSSTQPINIELEHSLNQCTIKIVDTGRGIAESEQVSLFSKGFTTNKAGGSGLGLYHARKVINSMRGKIVLSSKFGQGTTVVITLRDTSSLESREKLHLRLIESTQANNV